jgi:hypothetical protein
MRIGAGGSNSMLPPARFFSLALFEFDLGLFRNEKPNHQPDLKAKNGAKHQPYKNRLDPALARAMERPSLRSPERQLGELNHRGFL